MPLCTWLYLAALLLLAFIGAKHLSPASHQTLGNSLRSRFRVSKTAQDVELNDMETGGQTRRHTNTYKALSVLYYLLLLAQTLMCTLEIVRLSLANLGIGLLPFTFVTLITAAVNHFTKGLGGRIPGWRYVNVAVWIALAVTSGVKVAEETKEGLGARKGSKYPVADEVTDVSVMIGVYAVLALFEISLRI